MDFAASGKRTGFIRKEVEWKQIPYIDLSWPETFENLHLR